jgi:uncharacterized protein YacL
LPSRYSESAGPVNGARAAIIGVGTNRRLPRYTTRLLQLPRLTEQALKTKKSMLSEIFGLIVLILDIWTIVKILQNGAETLSKVIWILIILVLPIFGFAIWYFAGPRDKAPAA